MAYLKRILARPSLDDLTPAEARMVSERFDPYAGEVLLDGEPVNWEEIDEVEVVRSPRAAGPAGWVVRHLVHGDERYHVGIYFGRLEMVLPNVSLNVARYIVQCVAYFSPAPVIYNGPEGLSPVSE
jgi:hypothetical protein